MALRGVGIGAEKNSSAPLLPMTIGSPVRSTSTRRAKAMMYFRNTYACVLRGQKYLVMAGFQRA
jgi:hypothetical protein